MKTRKEIKALAKEAVAQQRGTAMLLEASFLAVGFVAGLIMVLLNTIGLILFIAIMFVLSVIAVNAFGEHIKVYRRERASVETVFTGLKVNFWRKLGGLLWMELWTLLWSLLLVVPGIIKGLAYSMTPAILAEYPNVEATQALKISMKMTDGHKGKIFVFTLSFIGWFILTALPISIIASTSVDVTPAGEVVLAAGSVGMFLLAFLLTAAIYVLYVGPYFYTAYAGLYTELRDNALRESKVTHEELRIAAPQPTHQPMIIN